jgi:hypothetical protein
MAQLTFSLAYGGPAVDDGTMDVRTLAPSLIALADLFRTANATLNRDSPSVTLEINATSRGSFEVHLLLSQPDLLAQAVSLFSGQQATALANLYGIVVGFGGAVKGVGGLLGLLGFIQLLRHRGIVKRESVDVGSIRVEFPDGTTLIVPADVLTLYDSLSIRRDAEAVVAPLNTRGVDSMELRRTSEQVSVRIEKDDVPSFEAPESLSTVPLYDTVTEQNVLLASVNFQEGGSWRFSDGNQIFWAEVSDQEFMSRVASSDEAFRSGDRLFVRMRVRQEEAADGGLKTTRTIEEVIQHIPRTQHTQLRLDSDTSP